MTANRREKMKRQGCLLRLATWGIFFFFVLIIFAGGRYFFAYHVARPYLQINQKNSSETTGIERRKKQQSFGQKEADNSVILCAVPGDLSNSSAILLSEYALDGNSFAKSGIDRCLYSPFAPKRFLCRTVAYLGDEKTLPGLIENARFWPKPDGVYLQRDIYHCYSGMERIINTSPGLLPAEWKNWYETYKSEPRETWLIRGFNEAGYKIDQFDQQCISELEKALSDDRRFIRENAVELLFTRFGEQGFKIIMDAFSHSALENYAYKHFVRLLRRTPLDTWALWMVPYLEKADQNNIRSIVGLCTTALEPVYPEAAEKSRRECLEDRRDHIVKFLKSPETFGAW